MKDAKFLLKYGNVGYGLYVALRECYETVGSRGGDEAAIRRKFRKIFGREPDLVDPQTMNEKIQWLKLHDRRDIKVVCADKYAVREWLVQEFGEDAKSHLIPLLYTTADWRDITGASLPDAPFIIKPNNGSHQYKIVRDKSKLDIPLLRRYCRMWHAVNHYHSGQEWQYSKMPYRLVVERLLQTSDGHVPNDYKLHYFNGRLEFVYCSIGRETVNSRNIYDADWKPLPFSWNSRSHATAFARGVEVPPPPSFDDMKRYGEHISKLFDYVRCDFYDVDGQMYFGEITFHHGGGFDMFIPDEYDLVYGRKLRLTGQK